MPRRPLAIRRLLSSTSAALVLLGGCTSDASQFAAHEAEDAVRAAEAAAETAELRRRIEALEALTRNPVDYDAPSAAIIGSPADSRFSIGRTEYGKFAAHVSNMRPYGTGSKVTLRILNLASSPLTDATITVNYNQYSIADRLKQLSSENETPPSPEPVELSSSKVFAPATWVEVDVTLPELPPTELRFVSVGFTANTVRASVAPG